MCFIQVGILLCLQRSKIFPANRLFIFSIRIRVFVKTVKTGCRHKSQSSGSCLFYMQLIARRSNRSAFLFNQQPPFKTHSFSLFIYRRMDARIIRIGMIRSLSVNHNLIIFYFYSALDLASQTGSKFNSVLLIGRDIHHNSLIGIRSK